MRRTTSSPFSSPLIMEILTVPLNSYKILIKTIEEISLLVLVPILQIVWQFVQFSPFINYSLLLYFLVSLSSLGTKRSRQSSYKTKQKLPELPYKDFFNLGGSPQISIIIISLIQLSVL